MSKNVLVMAQPLLADTKPLQQRAIHYTKVSVGDTKVQSLYRWRPPSVVTPRIGVVAMSNKARTTVITGRVGFLVLTAVGPFLNTTTLHKATLAMAQTPSAEISQLRHQVLGDLPGREVLMLSVEYPPGAVEVPHRHFGYALVYVLEGSIVMQVKGGEPVTLSRGQTFYEGPDDIHVVGRNASRTERARLVVFLLKQTGRPPVVPVP
jgi:quercetin dioxygenase-like cupin family protein